MQILADKIWHLIEKLVQVVLSFLFKLFHKDLSEEVLNSFMQFVKFGIVGVSNTVVSYVLYLGSLVAFQKLQILPNTDYLVAQIIAFMLSVLWSFYWNNKMVFVLEEGAHRSLWRALLKTYISYSFTGLFLNSILLVLWVRILHISEFIAPLINLVVSVPVNFLINKFWAFKAG
jgi:putative flippase GtrA